MSLPTHHCLLALCTMASVGCTSSAPGPSPQPPPEAVAIVTPHASSPEDDRLARLSAELSLRDQERSALAQHYFQTGQAHFAELQYRKASESFHQAHQADPNDREILEAKLRTDFILGDRQGEIASVAQALQNRVHRRIDHERVDVQRIFEEGEELLRAGRYREAEVRFTQVLERLRWFPYSIAPDGLEEKARRGRAEAKRGRRVGRREAAEEREERALAQAQRELRREERARRARLRALLRRAEDELRQERPRRAEGTLRDLASLAPGHAELAGLRARARSLRHRLAERGTAARNRHNQRVDRIANREAAVPSFPGD